MLRTGKHNYYRRVFPKALVSVTRPLFGRAAMTRQVPRRVAGCKKLHIRIFVSSLIIDTET